MCPIPVVLGPDSRQADWQKVEDSQDEAWGELEKWPNPAKGRN